MHIDLNDYDGTASFHAEICVVGGGAAGITVARRLLTLGHSVTLLESGGLDYEPETANLNAGTNVGEAYYDLEDSRLRFFGGTTAIWGGRIAELDPIDLESRAWVPHSSWPIGWSELAAYYPLARRIFQIPESSVALSELRAQVPDFPQFNAEVLDIGLWDFDPRFNRFQFAACPDLASHARCTIVTHATVTELRLHPGGQHVEALTVKSLTGRHLSIKAGTVILAAGGIENPRLLLASRSVASHGIGNDHDQVGRYFMEHPHARGGRIVGAEAWTLLKAFGCRHSLGGRKAAALIKPSAALQEQRGILNTSLTIGARQPADASQDLGMRAYTKLKHGVAPTRRGRALWMATKKFANWAQSHTDPVRPWLLHRAGLRDLALIVRAEQAPNPQSRIVLTDQVDPLGMPRVALDWRMSRLDVESVGGLVSALDSELRRLGLGRVEASDWLSNGEGWSTDPMISAHPIGGYHHMGTTRMSDDPRAGVTDQSGRVHGVDNLYVVGSSVFPTSGWANPTLTVVALALRTGDQVSQRAMRDVAA